ncbi:MAG: flagellar export chaperone FlgN [Candidatus Gastranaerophilales bacterium]|nr:flagellar export chaperone FlgN [Candidatus Gastranaerophilales bacterium]
MQVNILELENVLIQELDIFSKLEKNIIDKKKHLVKSDIESVRIVDIEIEKLSDLIKDLEFKKAKILSKTGKNLNLSKVIEELEDKNKAKTLSLLKEKIKTIVSNIYRQNNINSQLIEHSLKLIEHTVKIITNVFMPESSAYNSLGRVKKNQVQTGVSSISQEA